MEPPGRPLVHGQPKPILIGLPAQAADLSKPKKGGAGAGKRSNYLGSGPAQRFTQRCLCCKEWLIWILSPLPALSPSAFSHSLWLTNTRKASGDPDARAKVTRPSTLTIIWVY